MSKREIKAGATSQTIDVFIQDSSVSTGAGLTGLVYNTSNLTAYYRKGATGTPTAITLATQTVGGAWSSGGFVAVDGTNCPGQYRLDLPNAVVDTAGMVTIYLRGATNMAPCVMELEIVAVDKFDTVRYGLTAIPNVAQGSTGSIPVSVDTSGRVDVLKINGTSQTARDLGTSVLISSGTGTGQLSVASGVIQSSLSEIQATPLNAIIDGVLDEDLSTHTTTGSLGQMQTDVFGFAGAAGSTTLPAIQAKTDLIPAAPASTTNITAGTITTVTNLTNAPTNGDLTATMKASVTAAVPTAAANATAARSELTTELGRIDAAVSTRLATAGYTAPPSAATVADAVLDEAVSDHTTAGTTGAQLASIYAAQIDFSDDEANSTDEFTVQWFKNGAPVTSGVTSPTIQVIKRADGTDLVASAAMTQIGSTGAYKYDEATNRVTSGEAVVVQVQATIDGATRTWRRMLSRDSAAA